MNVSISRIKTFKACRRAYYLKYMQELTPVNTADSLVTGKKYHEFIEAFHKGEDIEQEMTKEYAMFLAYKKYIAPKIPEDMIPEVEFSVTLNESDNFIGRVDGYCPRSKFIIEHKTVSAEITEEYEYDLLWDEQIPAYMYAMNSKNMIYTVCRKPSIRQKISEDDEAYFNRMVAWYDEDTDSKIKVLSVERTALELSQWFDDFSCMVKIIHAAEKNDVLYRNSLHCFRWGRRCEYASICMNYNPEEEYIEFRKGDRYGIEKNLE